MKTVNRIERAEKCGQPLVRASLPVPWQGLPVTTGSATFCQAALQMSHGMQVWAAHWAEVTSNCSLPHSVRVTQAEHVVPTRSPLAVFEPTPVSLVMMVTVAVVCSAANRPQHFVVDAQLEGATVLQHQPEWDGRRAVSCGPHNLAFTKNCIAHQHAVA